MLGIMSRLLKRRQVCWVLVLPTIRGAGDLVKNRADGRYDAGNCRLCRREPWATRYSVRAVYLVGVEVQVGAVPLGCRHISWGWQAVQMVRDAGSRCKVV